MIYKKFKHLVLPNVVLVTGGIKTGKSFLSVALAVKRYKQVKRQCFIRNLFRSKKRKEPLPMLYSNIKLRNVEYNLLTLDILQRKVKVPKRSVILIDEASLFADSMSIKNDLFNEQLLLFCKLYGHISYGGYIVFNTQSLSDLHYNIKRSISTYVWIYKRRKIPFFTMLYTRELVNGGDDLNMQNTFDKDVEETVKPILISNKYYKYYDCFCYSILTDNLPLQVDYKVKALNKYDSLKLDKIISLKKFLTVDSEVINNGQ